MKSHFFRKICASFLLLAVVGLGFNLQRSIAYAVVVPVHEVGANLGVNTKTTIEQTLDTLQEVWGNIKEFDLDKLFLAATKKLMLHFINDIIVWANTGFNGEPHFIRDPESFFTSIVDQRVIQFVRALKHAEESGKNPFGKEIALTLLQQYKSSYEQTVFNLDTTIGTDWPEFYNNFEVGGWKGWRALTQHLPNNPQGAFMLAQQELESLIVRDLKNAADDLGLNDGFLSVKKCVAYAEPDPLGSNPEENTPYPFQVDSPPQPGPYASGYVFDTNQPAPTPEFEYGIGSLNQDPESRHNCIRWETTTPGAVIKEQLTQALGSPLRQFEAADEFGEVLSSGFLILAQELATVGLNKLSRATSSAIGIGGGPGSNTVGGSIISSSSDIESIWNQFDGTEPVDLYVEDENGETVLERAIRMTQEQVNIYKDTLNLLRSFPDALHRLDIWIPGPGFGWEERLNDIIDTKTKKLQRKVENDNDSAEETWDEMQNFIVQKIRNIQELMLTDNIEGSAEMLAQVARKNEYVLADQRFSDQYREKLRTLNLLTQLRSEVAFLDPLDPNDRQDLARISSRYVALIPDIASENSINVALNELGRYQFDAQEIERLKNKAIVEVNKPENDHLLQADGAQRLYCSGSQQLFEEGKLFGAEAHNVYSDGAQAANLFGANDLFKASETQFLKSTVGCGFDLGDNWYHAPLYSFYKLF